MIDFPALEAPGARDAKGPSSLSSLASALCALKIGIKNHFAAPLYVCVIYRISKFILERKGPRHAKRGLRRTVADFRYFFSPPLTKYCGERAVSRVGVNAGSVNRSMLFLQLLRVRSSLCKSRSRCLCSRRPNEVVWADFPLPPFSFFLLLLLLLAPPPPP